MSQQNSNITIPFFQKNKSLIFIAAGLIVFGLFIYFLYNKLYKKDNNKPVDCKLSDWIWDTSCNCEGSKDGIGKKFARKNIIQPPQYGGKECPTDYNELSKYLSCDCPVKTPPSTTRPGTTPPGTTPPVTTPPFTTPPVTTPPFTTPPGTTPRVTTPPSPTNPSAFNLCGNRYCDPNFNYCLNDQCIPNGPFGPSDPFGGDPFGGY
jgi:hypothetical protein